MTNTTINLTYQVGDKTKVAHALTASILQMKDVKLQKCTWGFPDKEIERRCFLYSGLENAEEFANTLIEKFRGKVLFSSPPLIVDPNNSFTRVGGWAVAPEGPSFSVFVDNPKGGLPPIPFAISVTDTPMPK